MLINKGQMVTFAEGVYSDYCVNGLVVALTNFNLEDEVSEWKVGNTTKSFCRYRHKTRDSVSGVDFLPWLVSKRLVEDVNYIEVHTGSYGTDISW